MRGGKGLCLRRVCGLNDCGLGGHTFCTSTKNLDNYNLNFTPHKSMGDNECQAHSKCISLPLPMYDVPSFHVLILLMCNRKNSGTGMDEEYRNLSGMRNIENPSGMRNIEIHQG